MIKSIIPEVLSPAGDEERLTAALRFGADAVYISGKSFGMRAACANFDRDGLLRAVKLTHAAGKKIYVTCNILPRNKDLDRIPEYFSYFRFQLPIDYLSSVLWRKHNVIFAIPFRMC